MIVLRCTRSILERLRISEPPEPTEAPSNVLGEWYVDLVRHGHRQIVLAASARSLLTVALPSRELRQALVPNLRDGLGNLLLALGLPSQTVTAELAHMDSAVFCRTANRRILGSMNQIRRAIVGGWFDDASLDAISLSFSQGLFTMLAAKGGYERPAIVVGRLFDCPVRVRDWRTEGWKMVAPERDPQP